jgi:hypothetical protein
MGVQKMSDQIKPPLSNHPIHPWYGPCDELADGVCAECIKEIERLRGTLKKAGDIAFNSAITGEEGHAAREAILDLIEPSKCKGGKLMSDEFMITVTGSALREILEAISGPGYLIRELQAIQSLGNSPITTLADEYNAAVKARNKVTLSELQKNTEHPSVSNTPDRSSDTPEGID